MKVVWICFLAGCGMAEQEPSPALEQGTISAVDLLLVWDRSLKMIDSLDDLSAELPSVLEATRTQFPKASIHVGVISADLSGGGCEKPGDMGQLLLPNSRNGIAGCMPDAGRFEVLEVSDRAETTVWSTRQEIHEVAAGIICRGISDHDCGLEQPLESMLQAISPSHTSFRFRTGEGQRDLTNQGFFREEALLVVYLASNEDDCSFHDESRFVSGRTGVNCSTQRQALHAVERYVRGIGAVHSPSRLALFIHGGIPLDMIDWPLQPMADELVAVIDDHTGDTVAHCRRPGGGKAIGPRRALELGARLRPLGARVDVGSLCRVSFEEDTARFQRLLSRFTAEVD